MCVQGRNRSVSYKFKELKIGSKITVKAPDPDPTQMEIEYMVENTFLEMDLAECDKEQENIVDGVNANCNQQEINRMVQTALQDISLPHTHSAKLNLFDKISEQQQHLACMQVEIEKNSCYRFDENNPGL